MESSRSPIQNAFHSNQNGFSPSDNGNGFIIDTGGERIANDQIAKRMPVQVDRRNEEHTTSNLQTLMHLIKGNIGTGVFAMAGAVKNAGLATGVAAIVLMGAICIHCMHILVNCSHILCKKEEKSAMDYGEVVEAAFRNSSCAKYAGKAKWLVNFYLVVSQFGFCCVYIVYVAKSFDDVICHHTGVNIDIKAYIAIVLPFLILLSFIRSLKALAPLSMLANVILCVALIVVFQYVFRNLKAYDTVPQFAGWKKLPLFFGTAIYAFEGIGIILPIENRMKNPQDFSGCTGILNVGMILITVLYSAAGFYGYLAFGESVNDSIIINLPYEPAYDAAKVIVAIVIFYSYSLQLYVPVEILWPWMRQRLHGENHVKYGEYLFRAGLVIFTFIFAVAIPKLGLFISLVGAIGSSFLALIMPPILEVVTLGMGDLGFLRWKLIKNVLIGLFGLAGCVLGTYISIEQIIMSFKNDSGDPQCKCACD